MLLGIDKNGQVYEMDARTDNPSGYGKNAPMVDDYNMQTLSADESEQVRRDRRKLELLRNLKKLENNYQKLKKRNAAIKKEKATAKIRDYIKSLQNKKQYAHNIKRNAALTDALYQSNFPENTKMSGVTGFALTSDGRQPQPDQPPIDWDKYQQATKAFGGITDYDVASHIAKKYGVEIAKANKKLLQYSQKPFTNKKAHPLLNVGALKKEPDMKKSIYELEKTLTAQDQKLKVY